MTFEGGKSPEALPTELPGEWVDMTGEKIVIRAGQAGHLVSGQEFTIEAGLAQKAKMVGKYNHYEGTMIVGAPDGSMKATRYSSAKEEALKRAGYRKAALVTPSLFGHQRFQNDETQRKFEAS